MVRIKISFPSALKYTNDVYDSNVDAFVELEDGFEYTVILATPKNFLTLMDKDEIDFWGPG